MACLTPFVTPLCFCARLIILAMCYIVLKIIPLFCICPFTGIMLWRNASSVAGEMHKSNGSYEELIQIPFLCFNSLRFGSSDNFRTAIKLKNGRNDEILVNNLQKQTWIRWAIVKKSWFVCVRKKTTRVTILLLAWTQTLSLFCGDWTIQTRLLSSIFHGATYYTAQARPDFCLYKLKHWVINQILHGS